ncbi:MAG: response regulator [Deltaproteobacteria bacterium]|nr:response regulator [Deltaproteobacteria bacterium]
MEDFRVLVVDDEDDFRETLIKRLQKRNLDVSGAENGEKALEMIDKYLYDVVILDVKMPGIDGIEALREIKRRKPLVEVIMLTGHASVESGIEGMKLGAFDYLTKPADFDQFLEKLRQAYEKKFAHDEKIRQATIRDLAGHPARIFQQLKEEKKK